GGARVLTGHDVTAVASRPRGGYSLTTSGGEVVAGGLVIAAGAGCWPVGAMLDLDIPIVPVRGQMWATAPLPPRSFHTISAAESAMAWARDHGGAPPDLTIRDGRRVTRHLYGRQRRNGEIIFGGDRELAAYDTTPDPKGIALNPDHPLPVPPPLPR